MRKHPVHHLALLVETVLKKQEEVEADPLVVKKEMVVGVVETVVVGVVMIIKTAHLQLLHQQLALQIGVVGGVQVVMMVGEILAVVVVGGVQVVVVVGEVEVGSGLHHLMNMHVCLNH